MSRLDALKQDELSRSLKSLEALSDSLVECAVTTTDETDSCGDKRQVYRKKAVMEKTQWGSVCEFFWSTIGYSVGLGVIWRFPYVCMENGGAAFLFAVLIFLCILGFPLFYMELAIGQYSGLGPMKLWNRICPLMKGIGYSNMAINFAVCLYYNVILGWSVYYIILTFINITQPKMPWDTCPPNGTVSWDCKERRHSEGLSETVNNSHKSLTPTEGYFNYNILDISSGIGDIGNIQWELLLCLAVMWLFTFLCVSKGIQSSGKVVYVTAILPYLMLFALLVGSLMLPGSSQGLIFFFNPDWSRLLSTKLWYEACVEVFFMLGPAWGGIVKMASHNPFRHNFYREAYLVPIVCFASAVFVGTVVFATMGFMSYEYGIGIEEVVTSGPGLLYCVFPEAVQLLPLPALWSLVFHFTILLIGVDSQFGLFETLLHGARETWPELERRKTLLAGLSCFAMLIMGLIFCTNAGMYWLQVIDAYATTFGLMVVGLLEVVTVMWIYGRHEFEKLVLEMTGKPAPKLLLLCLRYVTLPVIFVIFIATCIKTSPPKYMGQDYPEWAITIGLMLSVAVILPIFFGAMHTLFVTEGSIREKLRMSIRPRTTWCASGSSEMEQPLADFDTEKDAL